MITDNRDLDLGPNINRDQDVLIAMEAPLRWLP